MKKKNTERCRGIRRLAVLFLAVLLVAGYTTIPAHAAGNAHFADVGPTHWAFQHVERAYEDGAIVGTGGDPASGTGIFSPDTNMTYGQFLTMLVNAFYRDELARVSKDGPWYAPAFRVAANRQLTFIKEERLMEIASNPINRYNAAWILVRILDDKSVVLPTDQERAAAAKQIGDWSTVLADEHWEYFVSSIYAMGIISGVDNKGTFAGNDHITRASAAVIYSKMAGKLKAGQNDPKAFQVIFEGDWSVVPKSFKDALEEEFYTVYPRLWARWGAAETSKHIKVWMTPKAEIDGNAGLTSYPYDSLRHQNTLEIRLSLEYLSEHLDNREVFAHEMTHAATRNSTHKSVWLRECLADYGAFRYAAWADDKYVCAEFLYQTDDQALRDWYYKAYGDSMWFFAWLDQKYPTTKTSYGLLDSIFLAIQKDQVTTDGGTDQSDADFNAVVKQVTGYSNIEQLRQKYVAELNNGTWTFNGFAGFPDNYITENLPGVPNPTYPSANGLNLCIDAHTYSASGERSKSLEANNLVDGDRSTKWQAAKSDVKEPSKLWTGVQHSVCVSLGKKMTFNSYTIYHGGSQEDGTGNTKAWRIRYYDDQQEKWVILDEVKDNTQSVTTRTFKPVTARSLWLEILDPGTGDGTVNLYELELYDQR